VCIGTVKDDKGVFKLLQTLAQMHQRLDKLEKELTVIRKDKESSSKKINGNIKNSLINWRSYVDLYCKQNQADQNFSWDTKFVHSKSIYRH